MSMERSHGLEDSQIIADTNLTSPATGTLGWFAVLVIANAVLNTTGTAASNVSNLTALNGVTITAGSILYGRFTAIQLASGTVQAFKLRDPNA